MAQEPYKQDNKSKLPKFTNRPPNNGGGDDNNSRRGPRFSIYWIYAIIFAVLIGFQFFGPFSPNMAEITANKFKEMVLQQDVQEYIIVRNRNVVRVVLKPTSISKYRDNPGYYEGKLGNDSPQMFFRVVSAEEFQKEMRDFYTQNRIPFTGEV
ncbi:MAG: ATP-dependent metallopeptidase FtsH/Yme1/Tma family protein, partial [Flavisolibacter sp.]|nr:ATP-dependent metallopeptidase FtsH/Yme1/Tma family protein [Flavisolibacter sp.]